jgi:hypothetical protein
MLQPSGNLLASAVRRRRSPSVGARFDLPHRTEKEMNERKPIYWNYSKWKGTTSHAKSK